MILDLLLYFAKFPSREGVLSIAVNGSSDMSQYAAVIEQLSQLPEESITPEINSYVFGQSYDSVKARIDKLSGTYMFVDFGEFDYGGDNRNSLLCTQKIAVTIARKLSDNVDLLEQAIASDSTIKLLSKVYASMYHDSQQGTSELFDRISMNKTQIIPFVATELHSIGWTIMIDMSAPDLLHIKTQSRSF